jgi:2-iminoacetate synthase
MLSRLQIENILKETTPTEIESLARQAKTIKEQFFGRTISLYAPLYLSNYCSSQCTYCGFNSHNRIRRFKLTDEEMQKEMQFVADQGIENILLLTGESYQATPLSYLQDAVVIAKKFFPAISLEVHPVGEPEYGQLFKNGVDGITVYQETYDRVRYKEVHIAGTKSDFDFRYGTPERAAKAGIRSISMGILLGLSPHTAEDLFSLYSHVRYMERNYPGVEYSLSFPRLKPIKGQAFAKSVVDDKTFIKVLCLTRLLFPRVGINLSTRETARLRDHAIELCVTRISAGSNTSVGGYTIKPENEQDPQFDIEDHRSVQEMMTLLKKRNFDPILTDWRRISNDHLTHANSTEIL